MIYAGLIHALPTSERRCLNRKEAASYVCVSVGTFDKLVREGTMPSPIDLCGRKVWDKRALDRQLDLSSGLTSEVHGGESTHSEPELTPLDLWRQSCERH